jgi:hypothetical protein
MAMSPVGNCRHACKDDGLLYAMKVSEESHHAEPPFVSPPCRAPLGVSPCRLQSLTTGFPHHTEPHWVSPPSRAPAVPTMHSLTGYPHHAEPYRVSPPCRASLGVPTTQILTRCLHHAEPYRMPPTMQNLPGCPRRAETCWVSSP